MQIHEQLAFPTRYCGVINMSTRAAKVPLGVLEVLPFSYFDDIWACLKVAQF
jgi:hypothetical protein